ncbi:hypothetical protein llap_14875 [Limosa lapponica baueri]|uniref:Uncharacterized protein n=1 Tax=Limosa lapponica baueri TaxID=1758121 RepID=A0A2I0TLY0_LIMLA|nr:hypothetical protein llap_14875 [Limosa lapponica baueri]
MAEEKILMDKGGGEYAVINLGILFWSRGQNRLCSPNTLRHIRGSPGTAASLQKYKPILSPELELVEVGDPINSYKEIREGASVNKTKFDNLDEIQQYV